LKSDSIVEAPKESVNEPKEDKSPKIEKEIKITPAKKRVSFIEADDSKEKSLTQKFNKLRRSYDVDEGKTFKVAFVEGVDKNTSDIAEENVVEGDIGVDKIGDCPSETAVVKAGNAADEIAKDGDGAGDIAQECDEIETNGKEEHVEGKFFED